MHEQDIARLTDTSLGKEVFSCLVLGIFVVPFLFVVVCISRLYSFVTTFLTLKLEARRKHDALMLRRQTLHLTKEVLSHFSCLYFGL
jgi:hypothetical protein